MRNWQRDWLSSYLCWSKAEVSDGNQLSYSDVKPVQSVRWVKARKSHAEMPNGSKGSSENPTEKLEKLIIRDIFFWKMPVVYWNQFQVCSQSVACIWPGSSQGFRKNEFPLLLLVVYIVLWSTSHIDSSASRVLFQTGKKCLCSCEGWYKWKTQFSFSDIEGPAQGVTEVLPFYS